MIKIKNEEVVPIVLCIKIAESKHIHPDSVINKCDWCGCKVWIMPHNLEHKKICRTCLMTKIKPEDIGLVGIRKIDMEKAKEEINRENKT